MRQMPEGGVRTSSPQTDRKRFNKISKYREAFNIAEWYSHCSRSVRIAERIRDKMSLEQLQSNCSRGITLGLIDPAKSDVDGDRIPLPQGIRKVAARAPWKVFGISPDRSSASTKQFPDKGQNRDFHFTPIHVKRVRCTPSPPSTHSPSREASPRRSALDSVSEVVGISGASNNLAPDRTAIVPGPRVLQGTEWDLNKEDEDQDEETPQPLSDYKEKREEDQLDELEKLIWQTAKAERVQKKARGSRSPEISKTSDEDIEGDVSEDAQALLQSDADSTVENELVWITHPQTGQERLISRPAVEQQLETLNEKILQAGRAQTNQEDVERLVFSETAATSA